MSTFFADPLHQQFAEWAIGFAPYGGIDYGELQAIAAKVKPADDGSYFDALNGFAQRRIDEADAATAKGHDASARECYLRGAMLLSLAYHPLFGTPVDPRLVDAFHRMMVAFDNAMALGGTPAEKLDIAWQGTTLPAWFLRAEGHERDVRPTILVGGGWDSCLVDNYFGIGAARCAAATMCCSTTDPDKVGC